MTTSGIKIIFMGTPEFATASLKALVNSGFSIVAVVTAMDKPAGRGQKIQESDVKQFATSINIPVLQPEKLKDQQFIEQLKSFNADLFVVVAFRMLPEIVWSMPRLGTINVHGSLLPHYRGAAPINWAVINGETETGVTTFFIEKEIDTGKIIFTEKISIGPDDTAGIVHDKLMETGAQLVIKTVAAIKQGVYPQNDQLSLLKPGEIIKVAPKIFKDDCKIDWNLTVIQIHDFIRGLSPYPTAWSTLTNMQTSEKLSIKIFSSQIELTKHTIPPKTIVSDGKTFLKIALEDGYIHLLNLQIEGKKRLSVEELLRGFTIENYYIE